VQIYEAVRLAGERQVDVAARHGLSQRRVSAICAQVDEWHRWASTARHGEDIQAQQRRIALLQARQRSERLFLLALKQAARKQEQLVTERRKIAGGREVIERTTREEPIDAQWLKLAGQMSRDLVRMNERLCPAVESSLTMEEVDRLLAEWAAEEEGPSESDRPKPNEGANYSSSSKTNGVSSPMDQLISAGPTAEERCADETCGDISGRDGGENRDEKNVRFIAAKVFYDADAERTPAAKARTAKPVPADARTELPREVRQRRAKFLRG
jgi:hypothetical protein